MPVGPPAILCVFCRAGIFRRLYSGLIGFYLGSGPVCTAWLPARSRSYTHPSRHLGLDGELCVKSHLRDSARLVSIPPPYIAVLFIRTIGCARSVIMSSVDFRDALSTHRCPKRTRAHIVACLGEIRKYWPFFGWAIVLQLSKRIYGG